jgi:hypothetical protein
MKTLLEDYREWNEVAGVIPKGTSWDYEIESIFEDGDKRIAQLESTLQLIGNELSLHADQGPAGEAFRALLSPTFGFPLENASEPK